MTLLNWMKRNKFLTVVIIVVAYLALQFVNTFFGVDVLQMEIPSESVTQRSLQGTGSLGAPSAGRGIALPNSYLPPEQDFAPQPDVENRLVIQESSTSLLVEDVVGTRNKILEYTRANGGYMVNTYTSSPEDAPTATVVIRIPSENLQAALDHFHSLSVKVVSENLNGRDVTDQYIDIEKRIETYESSKARFEAILDQATEVEDITRLTREIINMQSQIDALKGQQQALEQNARMAKLTIYLATDEIALPYTPSETFRPEVIFKLAVRSLVGFARKLATIAIWVGVYSVIWVPVALIIWYVRKRRAKNPPANPQN